LRQSAGGYGRHRDGAAVIIAPDRDSKVPLLVIA
jgi:hypothetical protein